MRTLVLILLAVLAWQTPPAAAQTPEQKAAAKQLFDDATKQYKLGHFEDALAGYEQAYASYPAPAFLFNIAQCHLQLGNWDKAIFFFEGYLRDKPDATNRELVEDLIRESKEKRAAAEEAERKRLEAEKVRLATERKAAEDEALRRREQERAAAPPAREEPRDTARRPLYRKWWFWAIVGGAAVGAVATVAATSGGTRTELPEGSLGTWDRR